jgi:hypothetical protein
MAFKSVWGFDPDGVIRARFGVNRMLTNLRSGADE